MQIALTATVKLLDSTFPYWCSHHLRFFDTIFLWMDEADELDSPFLPHNPRIVVHLGSQDVSRSVHGRFMLRQDANSNSALKLCLERNIEWLCHLDSDELLYAPSREQLLAELIAECGQIRFINHEVWPIWEADNPFLSCSVFKVNGRNPFFHFYGNGKSAVRCGPEVWARGAHQFIGFSGSTKTSQSSVVLHYACATYKVWLKKYANLGDFPSYWWDDVKSPIRLGFHLASRDVYLRCVEKNSFVEAEAFFLEKTLNEDAIPLLKNVGSIAIYHPIVKDPFDTLANP